jgi:hypothetical protein
MPAGYEKCDGYNFFRGKTGKYDIFGGIPREGIPMDTKEREKLITEAEA